jgi:hypothetical protein
MNNERNRRNGRKWKQQIDSSDGVILISADSYELLEMLLSTGDCNQKLQIKLVTFDSGLDINY